MDNPTYEKLDGILVSMDWEQKFPLTTVNSLERVLSNHTPIVLNTRAASDTRNQNLFKFELGWLKRDGFIDLVAQVC